MVLVHLCDWCDSRIGETKFVLDGFRLMAGIEVKAQVCDKEFCTLLCQFRYLRNFFKGSKLVDDIMV